MRSVLEDVKQRHMTVTNYCPVLDRFIEKNPGYVPLIDSGNPGTGLTAAVMPRLPHVCNPGLRRKNPTCQANRRKDAA